MSLGFGPGRVDLASADSEKTSEKTSTEGASPSAASREGTGAQGASTVWVFRPDGAKSCMPGSAKSLSEGAEDLRGAKIPVLDSKKAHDHKLHSQVCGATTGSENSFLIPSDFLKQAMALGYQVKNAR